jgi:lysozyme family protein
MPRYRIEFRSYNIGADALPVPGLGMGAAHNFIAVVEIVPGETKPRVVEEFHADSADEHGKPIAFDATGRGRLTYRVERQGPRGTRLYQDSERHPKFVLFEGTWAEIDQRLQAAYETGEWINKKKFRYNPLGTNSNSAAYTMARAMGFDVTGQPIDGKTGRSLPAPGRGIDLTKGHADAPPKRYGQPRRTFGYGDADVPRERPIPPEREAPPYDGPELPRRGAAPSSAAPASYRLGFENARRFADEHRFDPSGISEPSQEQNRIMTTWVERTLGPAVAHARLPRALAGDVLDHAARTTPREAALALQEGLNRLAGTAGFGKTAPAFADGSAKRVAEDGWIGPETIAAVEKHAAESGLGRMCERVALAAFRRGLDALGGGGTDATEAPAVFRRSIGRLYRDPSAPAAWPGSLPRHDEVAALQESINDANRIFAFAGEPLVVDGDLGPKTGAALVKAARAAGSERLTDHVGKRLGIGERDLLHNPARGFDRALEEEDDDASVWGAPALRALA